MGEIQRNISSISTTPYVAGIKYHFSNNLNSRLTLYHQGRDHEIGYMQPWPALSQVGQRGLRYIQNGNPWISALNYTITIYMSFTQTTPVYTLLVTQISSSLGSRNLPVPLIQECQSYRGDARVMFAYDSGEP